MERGDRHAREHRKSGAIASVSRTEPYMTRSVSIERRTSYLVKLLQELDRSRECYRTFTLGVAAVS